MTTFLALYRGDTIAEARLIAVSADPSLTAFVANRLLTLKTYSDGDPVQGSLEHGQQAALRLIKKEAEEASIHD